MLDSVFFDMGGTLEDVTFDTSTEQRVTRVLMDMLREAGLKVDMTPDAFWNKIWPGVLRYKKYSQTNMVELKPEIIWPEYYLADFDFDRAVIEKIAEKLAGAWEVNYYNRALRPRVKEMLEALKADGYRLGVISNNASLDSVFDVLEQYGIRDYFDEVIVSSCTGYRKPNPGIFHIAMRMAQSKPENCAYVGDTVSRDLIGAKWAGFGKCILIKSFLTANSDRADNTQNAPEADHVITDIYDVATILKK